MVTLTLESQARLSVFILPLLSCDISVKCKRMILTLTSAWHKIPGRICCRGLLTQNEWGIFEPTKCAALQLQGILYLKTRQSSLPAPM